MRLSVVILMCATALSTGNAYAQASPASSPIPPQPAAPDLDSGNDSSDVQLSDIVVTAQRRAENLQKVPIAVVAVSGETLAQSGVADLQSLKVVAPGFQVESTNGYATPHLRGVGSTAAAAGYENAIAFYVDGVYLASPSASLLTLNNIERVEVLKGPQGTLFGRNATGGLVQVVTKTPSFTPTADFNFGYANYQTVTANAYVASGLTDTLAADLAVHYSHQGKGWGTNFFNGKDVYKVDHDFAGRTKFLFKPSSQTEIILSADYNDTVGSNNAVRLDPGSQTIPPGVSSTYPGLWNTNTDTQPKVATKGGGGSLHVRQSISDIDLLSITAYRKSKFRTIFDYDLTPLQILGFDASQSDNQFSQELQVQSSANSTFKWVVGGYYFKGRGTYNFVDVTLSPIPALNPNFPIGTVRTASSQGTESIAGYAQGTLALGDSLHLTLGGRYTHEKRDFRGTLTGKFLLPLPDATLATVADQKVKFSRFTYRAAIDYQISDDILAYASINTGFKSGGFNASTIADPAFQPEKLTAYEVGLKNQLFDRRVRFNISGFYYEYKDLQVQRLLQFGTGIINGSAKIYGGEAELEIQATRELRLHAGAQLLHTEFTNFPGAPLGSPNGGVPVTAFDAKGRDIPFSPTSIFNADATYTVPVGEGSIVLNGVVYHSGRYFLTPDNLTTQNSYTMLNSSVRWNVGRSGLYLAGWINNIANEAVVSFGFTSAPLGNIGRYLQAPRTYGGTIGFKF